MYCVKCGSQIQDDVNFCPFCGARVRTEQNTSTKLTVEQEPSHTSHKGE